MAGFFYDAGRVLTEQRFASRLGAFSGRLDRGRLVGVGHGGGSFAFAGHRIGYDLIGHRLGDFGITSGQRGFRSDVSSGVGQLALGFLDRRRLGTSYVSDGGGAQLRFDVIQVSGAFAGFTGGQVTDLDSSGQTALVFAASGESDVQVFGTDVGETLAAQVQGNTGNDVRVAQSDFPLFLLKQLHCCELFELIGHDTSFCGCHGICHVFCLGSYDLYSSFSDLGRPVKVRVLLGSPVDHLLL